MAQLLPVHLASPAFEQVVSHQAVHDRFIAEIVIAKIDAAQRD